MSNGLKPAPTLIWYSAQAEPLAGISWHIHNWTSLVAICDKDQPGKRKAGGPVQTRGNGHSREESNQEAEVPALLKSPLLDQLERFAATSKKDSQLKWPPSLGTSLPALGYHWCRILAEKPGVLSHHYDTSLQRKIIASWHSPEFTNCAKHESHVWISCKFCNHPK